MRRLAFAVAIAVGFCSSTSAAGTVPFKAAIDTVFTPPAPCGGPFFCLQISGQGQGSHFGHLQMDGPSQLNFATLIQTGTSTLTVADGSTLVIALVGSFVPDATGGATFQGAWHSTSGTGRFEGESGSGTYSGSASAGVGVLDMDGRLSNPGKK